MDCSEVRPSILWSSLCSRRARFGIADRDARSIDRALNVSASWASGDVCGINQNHSAAGESLSGDLQLVTKIQAGVTKTP